MHYLSGDEIISIHDQIIEATGGGFGVREPELLESIVAKPQLSFGGHQLYPDLFTKVAAFYEALCNYHVFIDGNKRTAAISLYRFLVVNKYDLTASNEELEIFTLQTATEHPDLADVVQWIKHHSAQSKPPTPRN